MHKVAVVQAGSIPFDAEASIDKAMTKLREAAANGAELVVFPEAFIGGYPKGSTFGAPVGMRTGTGRAQFERYFDGAVTVDGSEVGRLAEAAREAGAFVVIGIIERSGNTLYCTAVMIDPERGVIGAHRKLMPTGTERVIWGFGDGSTLDTMDTSLGRVGSVICWENYMPLLRQAMYAKGVELYCAPTVDDRPTWTATMTHIALEGRTHVLSACQFITKSEFPDDHPFDEELPYGETAIRGGSVIITPTGEVLAGPVYDEETILYADIDPAAKTRSHLDFDVVGHYSRPDVFELKVHTEPRKSVSFD
ncbi:MULTISPECIES: carbon-nitrogen hydrolase family protein [unclassified Brevibacterium]|uniref:carbon-nitrogen hydrolase family protein n=1 Tax=unclassified Brevibacterium TaxID=2614124 RepID=UPI001091F82D|nr:carbon-nitrogen hydrolase family protein [Brevibacterium sp. S22]TGD31489.1 carbon-nitrogen hydrolase family protein [Brevibacterium sp. S22]